MEDGESLDRVLAELVDIRERLEALPADERAERARLGERQKALRAAARRLGPAAAPADVEARLASLHSELDRRLAARVTQSAGGQIGGRGGGIDPRLVDEMNRRIDEAMDIDGLRAEIRRLEHLRSSPETPRPAG